MNIPEELLFLGNFVVSEHPQCPFICIDDGGDNDNVAESIYNDGSVQNVGIGKAKAKGNIKVNKSRNKRNSRGKSPSQCRGEGKGRGKRGGWKEKAKDMVGV